MTTAHLHINAFFAVGLLPLRFSRKIFNMMLRDLMEKGQNTTLKFNKSFKPLLLKHEH